LEQAGELIYLTLGIRVIAVATAGKLDCYRLDSLIDWILFRSIGHG
jgi:hypothetical protein